MKHLILILLILLCACSDDNFRKVEQLDGFRILAIEASAPEVAPGGASTLRLFVSDTQGPTGGRIITGDTVACVDPGISMGAPVSCDHDPTSVTGNYTIDTTAADLSGNLYTGYSGSLNVTVPTTIHLGRSMREKSNGVGYIVIFTFTVDGQEVRSFKRIIATDRATLNTNPTGSVVLLNGASLAETPHEGDILNMTTSAPETYTYVNVDDSTETLSEGMSVAWFVSGAEFNKPKANLGEQVKLTTEPPAGPNLIIGIVRDDRGGVEVVRTKVP